ncbi:MAG: hypothetical protein JRE16_07540, partial [Deltaproteobacteria bacterium]|nr:hypothetical protein [Deltaproteobacteria bacterium]
HQRVVRDAGVAVAGVAATSASPVHAHAEGRSGGQDEHERGRKDQDDFTTRDDFGSRHDTPPN